MHSLTHSHSQPKVIKLINLLVCFNYVDNLCMKQLWRMKDDGMEEEEEEEEKATVASSEVD